jgi:hypothetical protein
LIGLWQFVSGRGVAEGEKVAVHVEDSDRGDLVRDIMKRNGLEDVSSASEK